MSYKDDEEIIGPSGEIEEEDLDLLGEEDDISILDDDMLDDDILSDDDEEVEFVGLDGSSTDY